jgi:hypothetical protein
MAAGRGEDLKSQPDRSSTSGASRTQDLLASAANVFDRGKRAWPRPSSLRLPPSGVAAEWTRCHHNGQRHSGQTR